MKKDDFLRYILTKNPALKLFLEKGDDFLAVTEPMNWCSQICSVSDKANLFSPSDPFTAFRIFKDYSAGVWCGGAAQFFSSICNLFGFESTVYGYG